MKSRRGDLTSEQSLALSVIFQIMGESRVNRSRAEYMHIASSLPPLKVLHLQVNEYLQNNADWLSKAKVCNFKAGDRSIWYKPHPTSISIETIRLALVNSGMTAAQVRRPKKRISY